jgi:glycosyl transferase, family 25
MLTVKLQGGLGNWLFQIAAGDHIAKQTGRKFFISHIIDRSRHSNENYFASILRNFSDLYQTPDYAPIIQVNEPSFNYIDWNSNLNSAEQIYCLVGYFQNYKYISDGFIEKLNFDKSITSKYPNLDRSAFIHIRGTDYKNHWLHDVGLANYYERAINAFPFGTQFYIFTNDEEYAKSLSFLKDIPHMFVRENEVNSLYLMSQCGIGGICANSSYSWWGAFLNPNRKIIMPNKWYNDPSLYIEGYYFQNATRLEVSYSWNFIHKAVYINLDRRTDRDNHMKEMTRCLGDKVIRFSAIEHNPGFVGCTKSHIAILEMAIQNKWKNVLILEDDAVWNKINQGYSTLRELTSKDYDVIVLGGTFVEHNQSRLINCKSTVGYLVNSKYYKTLLENFKEGLKHLEETNDLTNFAIDSFWAPLQARDKWFVVSPCLIYQKPDHSDICNNFQDYTNLFQLG